MSLHPEPFRTLLAQGRLEQASLLEAQDAPARFARGVAHLQLGHDAQARQDFDACIGELGDVALVEIAYLDIRVRGDLGSVRETLDLIAARAPRGSELEARTLHVLGLVLGKLRESNAASAALLRAAEIYRARRARPELAQVYDTLGSVFAAQGRLDYAIGHYALSLVAKTRVGDKYGIAITLGNLGRVHLRSGRFAEALDAFELDLELATELGDQRGRTRMFEDIGRAQYGLGRVKEAEHSLRMALGIAVDKGFRDLEFFARKDLALGMLRDGRAQEGTLELERAEKALGEGGEPYLQTVLLAARAQCLLALGDERALGMLEDACRRFAGADLIDHEIPALLALAGLHCKDGRMRAAAECLERAGSRARRDGYARYLPAIREHMTALQVVEPLAEEEGRRLALGSEANGDEVGDKTNGKAVLDGYQLLSSLGKGGFGEVFRAYDPQRNELVALKRFDLDSVYEPRLRRALLESARKELHAAARIRHPGVARVHAVGTDSSGATYVVQELIDGVSLRTRMPKAPTADPRAVFATSARIAAALQELHESGVVHRDLKPENILLRAPHGFPVLIDFGIAHVIGSAAPRPAGTVAYMAPEQALGREVGPAADLYSLGVILYEWLSGVKPIKARGGDVQAIADEIATRPPRPLADFRGDLSSAALDLVADLLAKDPSARLSAEETVDICLQLASASPEGRKWV